MAKTDRTKKPRVERRDGDPSNDDSLEAQLERALEENRLLKELLLSRSIDGDLADLAHFAGERTAAMQEHANRLQAMNAQLERLSLIDGLTGIGNRRRFESALVSEYRRGIRNSTALTVLMVDVDYFKEYNDNLGHHQGDLCLQKVSQCLSVSTRRPGDLACRFGGEEFIVLLPETSGENAVYCGERIRAAVEGLAIPHPTSPAKVVTVSIGVASRVPKEPTNANELVITADKAMYDAKKSGRNRVCQIK